MEEALLTSIKKVANGFVFCSSIVYLFYLVMWIRLIGPLMIVRVTRLYIYFFPSTNHLTLFFITHRHQSSLIKIKFFRFLCLDIVGTSQCQSPNLWPSKGGRGKCNYANQIKVGKMLEKPQRTWEGNERLHRRRSRVPVLVEGNLKAPH